MKNLVIISAPSGAGKTTICKALQKRDQSIKFSVSYTTREKRSNEIDGVDYNFISKDLPIGRQLNFLIQEISREMNTIGSKSTSNALINIIIIMKDELEKMREQAQNIL